MLKNIIEYFKLIQHVNYTLKVSKDIFRKNLEANIEIANIGFFEELGELYKPIKFRYKGLIENDTFKIRKYNIPPLLLIDTEYPTIQVISYCNYKEMDGCLLIECKLDALSFIPLFMFSFLTALILVILLYVAVHPENYFIILAILPIVLMMIFTYIACLIELFLAKRNMLLFFKEINNLDQLPK